MGKSGGRKKKNHSVAAAVVTPSPSPAPAPSQTTSASPPNANGSLDSSLLLRRAHELKEQGNRLFQSKDYTAALHHYDLALKLTPRHHPDRAVFHSNRAACLMQIRPVDHELVATECSLALEAQPLFPRALLRRARALESLKRYDLALKDVQMLLTIDSENKDALELARRLRTAVAPATGGVVDPGTSRPSPAALGASAVVAGLGPSLPSRPIPKKQAAANANKSSIGVGGGGGGGAAAVGSVSPLITNSQPKPVASNVAAPTKEILPTRETLKPVEPSGKKKKMKVENVGPVRQRPLKLVYDHDIRLAQMPEKCSFKVLRDIVAKRFPSSKSVLIKYKDSDGDLVTVTDTQELRLAESCLDQPLQMEAEKAEMGLSLMRLHIVEVNPEQEPTIIEEDHVEEEEEEEEEVEKEEPEEKAEPFQKIGSLEELTTNKEKALVKDGKKGCGHAECKEVEMDDWLLQFAELFRTQVGIDPDAHVDLHELGMELCSEALENTVTSEEAQALFEMAAAKFQEVAALALFNWGNVHMCAARKRIPLDENAPKEAMSTQLHTAYDWVRERFALAGSKYEAALNIKPDFYEGLLALGQQNFEMAKLHWSFAVADKVDLASWDSSETIDLFDSAEKKMREATEMWEKVEEKRMQEIKDPLVSKKEEVLKKKREGMEVTAEEAAEQAAVMQQQIHLFWGNLLFERSQVEYKLGFDGWKRNLDSAVERFKMAGASEEDINVVLKNHGSNADVDAVESEEKTLGIPDSNEVGANDEDKHVVDS
ncbi:Protein unc-45 [Carex littledalei]|uniref:Protein unc-45 n=1 Tax=Carex littledalei TaxID=544730 RepID=A0A833V6A0_9POAL|nr:Protein unc-45 [Carex littledalei]